MTANRTIFGITGGSGSGKSYISELLRGLGVTVLDADKIGHLVTEPRGSAYTELRAHFGSGVFAPDGTLMRRELAKVVFADERELRILNEITHKHIKNEIMKQLDCCSGLCAIDGAVIIGSTVEELCAFLIGVIAPEELRIDRICTRDGISRAQAEARIAAQPDEEFYRAHCRYIIENDGSGALLPQLERILEENRL